MKTSTIILLVILGLILLTILFFISCYNNLVRLRNKVKNAFSQIDVQLKKRFDLIPNLIEVVKGYAAHEKDIFGEFAKARQSYMKASSNNDVAAMAEANNALSSTLSRFIAVQEQYPELKADQSFNNLMGQLSSTEEQISFSRQFYNDTVLSYNNRREVFPTVIIANMLRFHAETFFKVDDEERGNIKVKF